MPSAVPPVSDTPEILMLSKILRTRAAGGAEPFEVFLPRMPQTTANRELLDRSAVGSTFMAALELARSAELALDQDAAFQGIVVTPLAAPVPDPVTAQAHK